MEPGVYHYSSAKHSLAALWTADVKNVLLSATNDQRISSAALVIVLTGVVGRTAQKYDVRGLRYVLIEAGHIAQNLSLVATALGLGCYCIGGFVDDQIGDLLDIRHEMEDALYLIAIGHARRK
jgi:SagB-type dehydrogenase family enzyme